VSTRFDEVAMFRFPALTVVHTENLKPDHGGDEVRPGWRSNE
jgi:hypothetical protein